MDECVDEWMDEWMNEWMNKQINEWMNDCIVYIDAVSCVPSQWRRCSLGRRGQTPRCSPSSSSPTMSWTRWRWSWTASTAGRIQSGARFWWTSSAPARTRWVGDCAPAATRWGGGGCAPAVGVGTHSWVSVSVSCSGAKAAAVREHWVRWARTENSSNALCWQFSGWPGLAFIIWAEFRTSLPTEPGR